MTLIAPRWYTSSIRIFDGSLLIAGGSSVLSKFYNVQPENSFEFFPRKEQTVRPSAFLERALPANLFPGYVSFHENWGLRTYLTMMYTDCLRCPTEQSSWWPTINPSFTISRRTRRPFFQTFRTASVLRTLWTARPSSFLYHPLTTSPKFSFAVGLTSTTGPSRTSCLPSSQPVPSALESRSLLRVSPRDGKSSTCWKGAS